MDLDQSLDDIIRKKKNQDSSSKKNHQQKANPHARQKQDKWAATHTHKKDKNKAHPPQRSMPNQRYQSGSVYRTSTGFHTSKEKYTDKPSILNRTSLGQRSAPYHKPKPASISTASLRSRNTPLKSNKPDPSAIVITKPVSRQNPAIGSSSNYYNRNNNNNNGSNNGSNDLYGLGRADRLFRRSPSPPPVSSSLLQRQQQQQQPSFSIRGLSGNSPGLSIRGESGPAIVLISNLDPAATADDVRTACMQFGQVLHCEVMTDRAGRYGEAEVEFATRASAAECVSKLDNEVADGRVLRAVLRQQSLAQRPSLPSASTRTHRSISPGPSSYSHHTRSSLAPTHTGFTSSGSGKMYSDQMATSGPLERTRQPPLDVGRFGPSRRH